MNSASVNRGLLFGGLLAVLGLHTLTLDGFPFVFQDEGIYASLGQHFQKTGYFGFGGLNGEDFGMDVNFPFAGRIPILAQAFFYSFFSPSLTLHRSISFLAFLVLLGSMFWFLKREESVNRRQKT